MQMEKEDEFNKAMKQDVNASERNRTLFIMAISIIVGVTAMPHDMVVATIASKYIFPSAAAGMCFGISFMSGLRLWMGSKEKKDE